MIINASAQYVNALYFAQKIRKIKEKVAENVFLCYPVYCKRTTYTKSQYCEGMKSRKVQEIPKAQRQEGYGGRKVQKIPGRSGRKGMEAEKDRKYPRHS